MSAPVTLPRRVVLTGALATLLAGPALAQAPRAASRVAVAGGAITEIMWALGLKDRIVGVDTTSLHPPEALRGLPNIGYVRALSAEGVLSLTPDLLLTLPGAGPPAAIELIRAAGVRVEQVPDEPSVAGVVARIEAIGRLMGAQAQADALAASVAAQFDTLARRRANLTAKKRVLFVLSLQNGRPLVGGRNSSAAAMIALAGGVNAADTIEGFKPITDEAVIASAPDLVLLMARDEAPVVPDTLFALPAFAATPAAATRAAIAMDGLYLLGFGPRAPRAAADLMDRLYGEGAGR
jgi:iron complex transport system substrate-binding protein